MIKLSLLSSPIFFIFLLTGNSFCVSWPAFFPLRGKSENPHTTILLTTATTVVHNATTFPDNSIGDLETYLTLHFNIVIAINVLLMIFLFSVGLCFVWKKFRLCRRNTDRSRSDDVFVNRNFDF